MPALCRLCPGFKPSLQVWRQSHVFLAPASRRFDKTGVIGAKLAPIRHQAGARPIPILWQTGAMPAWNRRQSGVSIRSIAQKYVTHIRLYMQIIHIIKSLIWRFYCNLKLSYFLFLIKIWARIIKFRLCLAIDHTLHQVFIKSSEKLWMSKMRFLTIIAYLSTIYNTLDSRVGYKVW